MVQRSGRVYEFGDFRLDTGRGLLYRDDRPVSLTPKVFDTLLLLIENSGRLVEKDEFMKRLWPDTFVGEDALAQNVSLLRKVLAESNHGSNYIATVPKRGYRFEVEVMQVPTIGHTGPLLPKQIEPTGGVVAQTATPSGTNSVNRPPRAAAKTWGTLRLTVIGLAILAAAAFSFLRNARSSKVQPPDIRGLAVLPLESLSGDPSQAYFADGLTDQLITDLSQISSLRVISRTSVMQYKGTRKPLSQITRELNVDAVVEGTILKSGDQVRITAQLILSPPERHLWAQTYVGDLNDVLALQQRISSDVASRIRSDLSPKQQARPSQGRAIPIDAYDDYLQGLYFKNQNSPEGLQNAITYFQRAIQKDPEYALGYVGLAHSYSELNYRDVLSPKDGKERAKAAALKAIQLDQTLAETHTVVASIEHDAFEWDASKTEKELQTAIELNPNYAPAHDRYSKLLLEQGRSDEALREAKLALELDPLSITIGSHLGDAFYYTRQYKQAIAQHKRLLELYPQASEPNQDLAMDYLADGDASQFLIQAQRWLDVSGEASSKDAARELGRLNPAEYRKGLRVLIKQAVAQRRTAYASTVWIAILYAEAGDKELALRWLEKGYDDRDPNLFWIRVEPAFDSLRTDPRFQKLSALVDGFL